MSLLISRVNSVRNFLASQCMNVDEEWISGCVEYITEDSSNSYTIAEIQNLAKEQWLLNDLKDICPGSLPLNLKGAAKTTLTGKYVLQINAAIDIGTPAYQQYLKLQKTNLENIEATTKFDDKVPCHRMVKLYLTDGKQEVSAIEYKPMRNLSCDITPGCKMLLKGPIESRRGVLLLSESSIELLGGEVQELAATHALPGLLADKLRLPPPEELDHNTTISIPRNANIPTPHTAMPSSRPADEPTAQRLDQSGQQFDQQARPIARVTSVQVANFADDDIDFDQIAAIEAEFSSKRSLDSTSLPNPEKRARIANNPVRTVYHQDEYPDENDLNLIASHSNSEKRLRSANNHKTVNDPVRTVNNQVRTENPDEYPDENEFNEDEDYLREMEAAFDRAPKGPISVSSEPFVYIKQIENMNVNEKAGRVFRVKAQIMKLLSKLSVSKDGWSLRCTIIDGTGSLNVDFTSDVLSKLVGYTPSEMSRLKKQMATQPDLKEKAVSALQNAKESLQVLYCIIELTILDTPKITVLIPFDESHARMLKKRLDGSGL